MGSAVKIIAGADAFGAPLKDHLVSYLRKNGVEVEDLGVDKHYSIGEQVGKRVSASPSSREQQQELKGLVVCGTGVGVGIFANKFSGVYAATCSSVDEAKNARSINNSNVLALGAGVTSPEDGQKIVDAWLSTPFKAPCPANGDQPWSEEVDKFLDKSLDEMQKVGGESNQQQQQECAVCALSSGRKFDPVDIMPGASMCILRQDPTSAVVRFKAGSLEPAHHHTFGHDLFVISGSKRVWNLTKQQAYDLSAGDFLYTPGGDVHRVKYLTDTEFFLRWDGHWDIFLDEDLATAAEAISAASK